MNISQKKQKQIALYALINGSQQALDFYSILPENLSSYIDALLDSENSLFEPILNELISSTKQKGVQCISETWGISPFCLEKLIKSFPSIEPSKTYKDNYCNINSKDMKSWATVSIQPLGANDESTPKKKRKIGEDKRKVTNYTIDQKIQAVKQFMKGLNQSESARELQIPAVNLMRWRDKLRKEAFQEPHVDNLYGIQKRGQKNKMFKELDAHIYAWYKENKNIQNLNLELINQAKSLAKIDEAEPVVKEIWLKSFKNNFKIE